MALQITQGSPDDVDLLEPLWLAMLARHREVMGGTVAIVPGAVSWGRKRPKYADLLAEDDSFLLLARLDGVPEPVGYLVASIERESTNALYDLWPAIGDIDAVVVDPRHRGQGIGTALMDDAKRRFVDLGCHRWALVVVEANAEAIQLYERLGFRPWERQMIAPLTTSTDA